MDWSGGKPHLSLCAQDHCDNTIVGECGSYNRKSLVSSSNRSHYEQFARLDGQIITNMKTLKTSIEAKHLFSYSE